MMALVVALASATACSVETGDSPGDDDDAGGSDASFGCRAVVELDPEFPTAPARVTATAVLLEPPSGVLDYTWAVSRAGQPVAVTPLDPATTRIAFDAPEPGVYSISLEVSSCQPAFRDLNVIAPGANQRAIRLRMVPPSTMDAPPQERTFVVTGGAAELALGTVILELGNALDLGVAGPAGAPVPAYLRFTSRATPDAVVEAFSGADGRARVRLVPGRYDVLVVPTTAAYAPIVVRDWDPATGALAIDEGRALTGVVLDGAGAPLAGARVSLMSGTVPSTVATVATDGRFTLRWRDDGGAKTLTVVSPPTSGLPRLDATLALDVVTDITIRHAALPLADVAGTVVRVGGAPAASVPVHVDLRRAAAGTVEAGGAVLGSATGSYRLRLRTGADGALPSARFVPTTGELFVVTGPGAIAAFTVPPVGPALAAAPVPVTGQVMRSAGGARAGARIRAHLVGRFAAPDIPAPESTAGADGRFMLPLAAGADYALSITDPTADDAARVDTLARATARDLGALVLAPAIAVSGYVVGSGGSGGARAVGVSALCHVDCVGLDRARPLGDSVTDATGRFVVAVPDPGVR